MYTMNEAAEILGVTIQELTNFLYARDEDIGLNEEDGSISQTTVSEATINEIMYENTGYYLSELYKVTELARELYVGRGTIYYRIQQGLIPSIRIGNGINSRLYIPKDQVQDLIALAKERSGASYFKRIHQTTDQLVELLLPLEKEKQDRVLEYVEGRLDGKAMELVTSEKIVLSLGDLSVEES